MIICEDSLDRFELKLELLDLMNFEDSLKVFVTFSELSDIFDVSESLGEAFSIREGNLFAL